MSIRGRFQHLFRQKSSLRFQLLSRSLLVMAGLMLIVGLFQYAVMREFIYQNKASSMQTQILSLSSDAWEQVVINSYVNGPNRVPFVFLPDSAIAFIDLGGNFSVLSNSRLDGGAPPKLAVDDYQAAVQAKRKLTYKVFDNGSGNEQLVVLQTIEDRGLLLGVIQVSVGTKALQDILLQQLFTFLALALLALIGGLLAFIPVLRKTLVPLSNMVGKVEQIDAGNLTERFPAEQGQMEIDRLATSFNGMLERLESSFAAEKEAKEQMRRFVADASHELRTPLTSIHGFLEVLLRGAENQPDKLHKSLTSMYAESERMKKLVQDLLLLAKLDRSPNIELTEGDLDDLIKEMEPQLRMLAGTRRVDLRLASHSRCWFDDDKMKQILLNLFHNAVEHTDPEKGVIEISLDAAGAGVELAVRDNGSGIPEEHLPHLFERFYRIDSSRTRKYGGAGLGLAISKSIVDLHGGTIRVKSAAGAGSVFYVWLPATKTI
ncbi:MAG: sensor histidine kinase [Desulfitobacteriaceae bacterium]